MAGTRGGMVGQLAPPPAPPANASAGGASPGRAHGHPSSSARQERLYALSHQPAPTRSPHRGGTSSSPPRRPPSCAAGARSPARSAASPLKALWDGSKLALVDKDLTALPLVPEEQRAAAVLYISRNSLASLEGVQQFGGLRVLSAAENLLASLAAVTPLRHCQELEVLALEGNPLTAMPNYRVSWSRQWRAAQRTLIAWRCM